MIQFPDLVPFHFVKEEVIDYKTTFPNRKNTQDDINLGYPHFEQVIPSEIMISFFLWETAGRIPTVTASLAASIVVTKMPTGSDLDLYKVTMIFSTEGDAIITIQDADETWTSNTITIIDSLLDEVDE